MFSRGPDTRMAEFADRHWSSRDGLQLHYRDYPGDPGRAPVLCLPGLTRNARDFEALAAHLAGPRRVLCADLRGRGDSDYARDGASYTPLQYLDDLALLFDAAGLSKVVAIGTSLGGLLTMLLAATGPERLAGAVLNDIGPEVDPAGIERIRSYVGQGRSFATWMHAARALEEAQGTNFPAFELSDWLVFAKRSMTVGSNGRIVFDYDMKIAEPLAKADAAAPPDLWPAFAALGGAEKGCPVLVIRGETSDILSPATLAAMVAALPGTQTLSVPGIGHAPTLDEPVAVAAIDALLSRAG